VGEPKQRERNYLAGYSKWSPRKAPVREMRKAEVRVKVEQSPDMLFSASA
jgi:hypothetical protein